MIQATHHLVFYDGECPICNLFVRLLLKKDKAALFLFAPLKGVTAKKELYGALQLASDVDSLVLLEYYACPEQKTLFRGKAVLRVAWRLGGFLKVFGLLSFLPTFWADFAYRIFAKYRYRLYSSLKNEPFPANFATRLLP